MSKFNQTLERTETVKNLAGGDAYQMSRKMEFTTTLLTNFLQDQYYRTSEGSEDRIDSLMKDMHDKQFLAKASIFARDRFNMRSITHLAAANIVQEVKGEEWVKRFINKVVIRPDDMTEIWSCYLSKYGSKKKDDNGKHVSRPIPNSLKKGTRLALKKFDEYQLGKYQSKKKEVSLIDIVNLSLGIKGFARPVEGKEITPVSKLITGTIEAPETWEVKHTKAGQTSTSKKDKEEKKAQNWKELIDNKKLGYMALLKNLRNIDAQADSGTLDKALVALTTPNFVKKSRVLPFRFFTAFDELTSSNASSTNNTKILNAISKACNIALDNIPTLPGKTLIALDVSGSMNGSWHSRSEGGITPRKIGAMFASCLHRSNNDTDLVTFDTSARYANICTDMGVIPLAKDIEFSGGGTDIGSIFRVASRAYDRIIILTDMESWAGYRPPTAYYNDYKNKHNTRPKIYSFNLCASGTIQFPEHDVYMLAGWSEQCFDIMSLMETDKNALIKEIEKIEI